MQLRLISTMISMLVAALATFGAAARTGALPAAPIALTRQTFLGKKPYKTAILFHQDLPDGGFLCLIPHLTPSLNMWKKRLNNYSI